MLRGTLVHVVRTSTQGVDRRRLPRYAVDLPCGLTVNGREAAARVQDLSIQGARVTGWPSLASGQSGSLRIDGASTALTFTALSTHDGALYLRFDLAAAVRRRFEIELGYLHKGHVLHAHNWESGVRGDRLPVSLVQKKIKGRKADYDRCGCAA